MSLSNNTLQDSDSGEYEHLGCLLLKFLRSKPKDGICQIDAADGSKETYGSVLSRTVRLARAMMRAGLVPGDALAIGGPNHLDLHIPYYAGLLTGLPIVGIDPYYKFDEIKTIFKITRPKIAFCQQEWSDDYAKAAKELDITMKIVTFNGENNIEQFIQTYDDVAANDDEFQAVPLKPDDLFWLVSTSGSSGTPKVAAFTNRIVTQKCLAFMKIGKPGNGKLSLTLSPVQWLSSYYNAVGLVLLDFVKLQTSKPDDLDHIIDIINEYKPVQLFSSPSVPSLILKREKHCDWTCFDSVAVIGAKIYKEVLEELKRRMRPDAVLTETYGSTESVGPVLIPNVTTPLGSCGKPIPTISAKLVDPETEQEITEPNVPGELWIKGNFFSGYYNNPEETAKVFTSDGWLKTGDLLYKDEEHNYYFVDRLKMLIKYRNYHIVPPEVEEVICRHPGVAEACVVGLPHREDGQRPAALVVLKPGVTMTEDDIHNLVAASLSDKKKLHGGVAFVTSLPKTSTGKIARPKLIQEATRLLGNFDK